MAEINSVKSYSTLSICHMAGMIDLAALPLWISCLMNFYGFSAPQAGAIVSSFLGAVVVASMLFAPLFNRLPHRFFVSGGFGGAAMAFLVVSFQPAPAATATVFVLLHMIAGLGAGTALSMTHGAIGRTSNPHRLFGIVNVAMGALAIVMFAILPKLAADIGGQVLFQGMSATMILACIVSLASFPKVERPALATKTSAEPVARAPIPAVAWLIITAVVCMTLNQATVFSYVERIGTFREFGSEKIQLVLIIMGFVNLAPGLLAAILQKRLSPLTVGIIGPVVQALAALSISNSTTLPVYAVPVIFYVSLVIFTHTFLFGLLARIDTTGRAVAATPAMMMLGSAIGPALGGMIVATIGYQGLGWSVCAFSTVAAGCILLVRRQMARTVVAPTLAIA